jgi:hypothetical protein
VSSPPNEARGSLQNPKSTPNQLRRNPHHRRSNSAFAHGVRSIDGGGDGEEVELIEFRIGGVARDVPRWRIEAGAVAS